MSKRGIKYNTVQEGVTEYNIFYDEENQYNTISKKCIIMTMNRKENEY